MPIEIGAILDFLRDSLGKITIALGAFFIFLAVPLLTRVYQWGFILSFLFGVSLILIGTALHSHSFKWKVPSREGICTTLIYVSFVFMAVAVVTTIFAVPNFVSLPIYGPNAIDAREPVAHSPFLTPPQRVREGQGVTVMMYERPYIWLAAPLMWTSLGLLAFGFLLKLARDDF